jgi:hypothetical protein
MSLFSQGEEKKEQSAGKRRREWAHQFEQEHQPRWEETVMYAQTTGRERLENIQDVKKEEFGAH